jgi:hypothetical protein
MLKRCSIQSMTKRKNPAAVVLGRLGGRKSGKVRMQKLTPEKRSEVARKAALARWGRQK